MHAVTRPPSFGIQRCLTAPGWLSAADGTNQSRFRVNDLKQRVAATEIELLQHKVTHLEAEVKKAGSDSKLLPKIKDIAAILTPLILAAVSFYVTNSITGAMQREKLDLDHLSVMKELMTELASPDIDSAKAEAVAVSLAAFGQAAIVPLIHELQVGGDIRPLAAEEGLRAIAFRDPETVCARLGDVLRNRSGLFSWQAQNSVIRLLGDIGCGAALEDLKEFQVRLEAPDALRAYSAVVRETPAPTVKSIKKLQETLRHALEKLHNH
jgi:hypothetical protein